MLLVHQSGSVKVGEVVRYTLTYTPSTDRILPTPKHLFVRIKNTSAIPLRAAYLHGPYTLHVSAYPSTFNPNHKVEDPERYGIPEFEPNLKAGGSWTGHLTVPEEIRQTGASQIAPQTTQEEPQSVTWIIEIASQILFSNSATVHYEALVSRDERSLEYGIAAFTGSEHSSPGKVQDHQQGKNRQEGHRVPQPKGIYSKAVKLKVEGTDRLWDKPALPQWPKKPGSQQPQGRPNAQASAKQRAKPKRQPRIHLVILTHGLHSNIGADMLYIKESIDATAREARLSARKRKRGDDGPGSGVSEDPATAPLLGGQENMNEDGPDPDDDEEQVIVRGYPGNVTRTERGIQYLGKRMAKHILRMTYPDQPYLPIKKSISKKLTGSFHSNSGKKDEETIPSHNGSSIHRNDGAEDEPPYTFTSISFVGHSLGGLVQLYAIAYIHKHSPHFFDRIKPVNFVCLASPLLGLSNENPVYVKFALDFGLVGRTGQDLGLTWRPPTIARSGWSAMVGGLGNAAQKEHHQHDPGAKPLLRILPTGPAHQVLRRFRNRTLYSNVVNDGIVPLRTSCLLFLDWRSLGKVEKYRRENGLIGTMAEWGWAELTGQRASSSPRPNGRQGQKSPRIPDEREGDTSGVESTPEDAALEVPQPADDTTTEDNAAFLAQKRSASGSEPQKSQLLNQQGHSPPSPRKPSQGTSAFDGIMNFFRPSAEHTKRDIRSYRRGQTRSDLALPETSNQSQGEASSSGNETPTRPKRPLATRGDTILDNPKSTRAPPKTTIFEAAGDLVNPPIPPTEWIVDPSLRPRTIFHDRVYHPEDIPPPPIRQRATSKRSFSSEESAATEATADPIDSGSIKVEEKIARAYHKDLSWRKVLVRLEPDAHNNLIVRRMFGNAYGWPVIKHLCDTHFADTYAAETRDEQEPAIDRAKASAAEIGEDGEEVYGQHDRKPPPCPTSEMREATDELAPLHSSTDGPLEDSRTSAARGRVMRQDSSASFWDDTYFGGTSDEDDDTSTQDNRNPFQRWLSPTRDSHKAKNTEDPPPLDIPKGRRAKDPLPNSGTSQAEIADFLVTSPTPVEGPRGLAVTEADDLTTKSREPDSDQDVKSPASEESTPPRSAGSQGSATAKVGLRSSIDESPGGSKRTSGVGVAEQIARLSLGKGEESVKEGSHESQDFAEDATKN